MNTLRISTWLRSIVIIMILIGCAVPPPPSVTFTAEPATVLLGNSATLTWDCLNADTIEIDQDIGSVVPSDTCQVSPGRTTTYTLTATGPGGTTTATALVTVEIPAAISIDIETPGQGDAIEDREVTVRGTYINTSGLETGINVNGTTAMIEGNRFVASRVPLQEGENVLTVSAVDTAGNTAQTTVLVHADTSRPSISTTAIPQSGLAPFETTLTIAGPVTLAQTEVTVDGPAQATVTPIDTVTHTLAMDAPGFYTIHVNATDSQGTGYIDTLIVQVLDREHLDELLQGKWDGMKADLTAGDLPGATARFSEGTKGFFEYNFNLLQDHLAEVVAGMQRATLVNATENLAEYNLEAVQGEETFSFHLVFEKSADGLWRIKFF